MIAGRLFECRIKTKAMVQGKDLPQTVTQKYLVDALTHSEAEATIIEETQPYSAGPVDVERIVKAHYSELFLKDELGDNDKFYRVKIVFIIYDDKTDTEKKTPSSFLVQGDSLENALKFFKEQMKGTMGDWEIVSISETQIQEVFLYKKKDNE